MELWELIARESIRDLVARYNANGDSGRFAQMLAVFADDASMELVAADGTVRRYDGIDKVATIFTETKAGWDAAATAVATGGGGAVTSGDTAGRETPAVRHHIRHFTSTHQIDLVDETHARRPLLFRSCSCPMASTTGGATSTNTACGTDAG